MPADAPPTLGADLLPSQTPEQMMDMLQAIFGVGGGGPPDAAARQREEEERNSFSGMYS